MEINPWTNRFTNDLSSGTLPTKWVVSIFVDSTVDLEGLV
jgi:hypothetical protein